MRRLLRRIRSTTNRWPRVLPSSGLCILYLVGVSASLYRAATTGIVAGDPVLAMEITAATYTVDALAQAVSFVAVLPVLHVLSGGRLTSVGRGLQWIAWATVLLQSFLFGSKSIIFLPLFVCALYYNHYIRRLRIVGVVGVVAGLAILVLPVLNVYRGDFYGTRPAPETISQAVSDLMDLPDFFTRYNPADLLVLGPEMYINRSHGIDSLAMLVMDADHGGNSGDSLSIVAIPMYAYVPRILWPSKPSANVAVAFGREYAANPEDSATSYTAVGMFNIGDFYSRGGVIGIVAGMLTLGVLYRLLYEYPKRSRSQAILFVYSFILWQVMNGFEGDIATVYSGALRSLVPLLGAVLTVLICGRLGRRDVISERHS